jgi:hypothetical protein
MILSASSDYFLKHRQPVDLCNGEVLCFLCGTDWIIKYSLDELRLQVALHAYHAALPMLTSKFRPKVAPHINIQISQNAALPGIISKFKIVHERSKTLLNFPPCSTSHPTFSASKRLTFH